MAEPTVEHLYVRPGAVGRRDYQVAVAAECLKRNSLVILPTGLGKTVVALLVIAGRLAARSGKVLFLAPTKPLVEQHAEFLAATLVPEVGRIATFTGEVPPAAREKEWRDAAIVVSTPEVVVNDLVQGRIDLKQVTLVVFDEAHRAAGDYAYVFIADKYRRSHLDGLVLGMTASPGASPDKIREVAGNLGIEGVEVRSEADPDVAPYVQDVDVHHEQVPLPASLRRIADMLQTMLDERIRELRALGVYRSNFANKKELLALQGRLQVELRNAGRDPPQHLFKALSLQAAALKVNHAIEMVETQGARALEAYLDKLAKDESKAAKAIAADPRLVEARRLLASSNVEHPKMRKVALLLEDQVRRKPDSRIIVFTNYRDMADALARELAAVEGLRPVRFVGQQSKGEDRGLTQAQQAAVIERFKAGDHNVLVATSVAEEGLDIPATDLVVFYEPVASEIRSIQRRGRTGRRRAGRVVVLVTKDTKDETYLWASRGKEKRMRDLVRTLKQWFSSVNASEETTEWKTMFAAGRPSTERSLDAFRVDPDPAPAPDPARAPRDRDGDRERDRPSAKTERLLSAFARKATDPSDPEAAPVVTIVADHREFRSAVVKELARMDVVVKADQLEVADYVLSDRLAVERKEGQDYVDSLLDGRLFREVRAMRDAYAASLVVIEGKDLFTARRVDPAAIYASIASLVADFRVTVLRTEDAAETAELLAALARREQKEGRRAVALRGSKRTMNDEERARYVVEGFPQVSAVLAKRLLARFGSVRGVADAGIDDLLEVEGVGPSIAGEIHRIANLAVSTEAPARKGSAPRRKKE